MSASSGRIVRPGEARKGLPSRGESPNDTDRGLGLRLEGLDSQVLELMSPVEVAESRVLSSGTVCLSKSASARMNEARSSTRTKLCSWKSSMKAKVLSSWSETLQLGTRSFSRTTRRSCSELKRPVRSRSSFLRSRSKGSGPKYAASLSLERMFSISHTGRMKRLGQSGRIASGHRVRLKSSDCERLGVDLGVDVASERSPRFNSRRC
mmetsp:Transcript_78835/g.189198  ORF Transcript_78835/g.189198 Transcript_78835/m.189198 type:complete len:208 (+) Transcript_78835:1041-1664(+)